MSRIWKDWYTKQLQPASEESWEHTRIIAERRRWLSGYRMSSGSGGVLQWPTRAPTGPGFEKERKEESRGPTKSQQPC